VICHSGNSHASMFHSAVACFSDTSIYRSAATAAQTTPVFETRSIFRRHGLYVLGDWASSSMVRPLISHKLLKFLCRDSRCNDSRSQDVLSPAQLPEFALLYPVIGSVAATTITVRCSACTAKETTGTAFQGFHILDLFHRDRYILLVAAKNSFNMVRVLSPTIIVPLQRQA